MHLQERRDSRIQLLSLRRRKIAYERAAEGLGVKDENLSMGGTCRSAVTAASSCPASGDAGSLMSAPLRV